MHLFVYGPGTERICSDIQESFPVQVKGILVDAIIILSVLLKGLFTKKIKFSYLMVHGFNF